jgi:hypothetical protein
LSHAGGIEGFKTWVGFIPAKNVDVIVLANLNGPASDAIANDLVRIADGECVARCIVRAGRGERQHDGRQ